MNTQVLELLREAQRRYQFHQDESLTEAWTGLGTRTAYEPVLKAGLMVWVSKCPPARASGWLRLTEAGVKIVRDWIDKEAGREFFPVYSLSRGDVNHALGLGLDHEFGLGLSDSQMENIAQRCGWAMSKLWDWDVLRDVLDVLGIHEEVPGKEIWAAKHTVDSKWTEVTTKLPSWYEEPREVNCENDD